MPCNEERTVTLSFTNADEVELLLSLTDLGISGSFNADTGTLKLAESDEPRIGEIKRAYATRLVKKAAKTKKWQVTEKGGKLVLTR
jgi:hypothetical protein